jgi:leucyl/phenylalanyl-tRNA--protein transferase
MQGIDADLLLKAYAVGVFPMAMSRDDPELHWFDPERRGIIPLNTFHVPKRLARTMKAQPYAISTDTDFEGVMRACAARDETWINESIVALYTDLFERGHAHSVECRRDGELVGGLYGVSLGGAFFGESMFSTATDASKIALVALVEILRAGNFTLLDTQYLTTHLAQFGAIEIPRVEYRKLLAEAVERPATFQSLGPSSASAGSSTLGRSAG